MTCNVNHRPGTAISRLIVAFMLALTLVGAAGAIAPERASAGQVGYINTEGAGLMAGFNDHTIIEWMEAGTPVDVLWGPENDKYEIRYYGVDGWVWAEYLDFDGPAPAASGGSGGGQGGATLPVPEPAAPQTGEHWIDVDRSEGSVTLYIGNEVQATYWGSFGWDTSDDGYYATAVGTYYVTWMDKSLTYTPFAKNYITHWVGFDWERANGFHSYTKNSKGKVVPGGDGPTGGCVALPDHAAEAVYDFAYPGMRVEVHN